MQEEQLSELRGRDGIVRGDEYGLLRQPINDYENGCEAQRGGELLDEVHGDGIPWSFGNWELFEQPIGSVTRGFCSGAGGAGFDVVFDVFPYAWPSVIAADEFESVALTEVT